MTKKPPSFEKQLEKLEEIRDRLESGELTLDDSIKLYEEGVKQLRACQERLAAYEEKIEELSAVEDEDAEDD